MKRVSIGVVSARNGKRTERGSSTTKNAAKLVDFDEVAEVIHFASARTNSELDRVFCNELPPVLKGLDESAVRSKCQTAIETVRDRLKEAFRRFDHDRSELEIINSAGRE